MASVWCSIDNIVTGFAPVSKCGAPFIIVAYIAHTFKFDSEVNNRTSNSGIFNLQIEQFSLRLRLLVPFSYDIGVVHNLSKIWITQQSNSKKENVQVRLSLSHYIITLLYITQIQYLCTS